MHSRGGLKMPVDEGLSLRANGAYLWSQVTLRRALEQLGRPDDRERFNQVIDVGFGV
jgi:hypothetical protein